MSSGKSGGYGKKHINKKCDKINKAGWVFILAATIMLVIAGGRLYSDSEERQLQKQMLLYLFFLQTSEAL